MTKDRFQEATSQGRRDEQQDRKIILSSEENQSALLVVTDGVGGSKGGAQAAEMVVRLAERLWQERKGTFDNPVEELEGLCVVAHEHINSGAHDGESSPRATIVALYLTQKEASWVHSGDSRLYHFKGEHLVSRTEDHSILQLMLKQGMVKEEEMGSHPDQGKLLQSLGGEVYKLPSSGTSAIDDEDAFLLCTDGFWERTSVAEMVQLLRSSRNDAAVRLRSAVNRAVSRNGSKSDNVTAVLALPEKQPVITEYPSRSTRIRIAAAVAIVLALLAIAGLSLKWFRKAEVAAPRPEHQAVVEHPKKPQPVSVPAPAPNRIHDPYLLPDGTFPVIITVRPSQ